MASLPGGEMETLVTSNPGGPRKRAQIGSEKKLKQVFTILQKYYFM